MSVVIKVENVSKKYQLGKVAAKTLKGDLQRWWADMQGKEDPLTKIGSKRDNKEEFWALSNINFEVNQGDAIGIIGKNGAGKSTLLKILSRVTAPTTGNIKVKGRVASLLEVGTGFNPELTGRENIFLNGAILGMSKGEVKRKFDEIVDFSGVEKFIDTPVKRYSSGMYVRLAFAVAAHLESEILILDEVLAVGDAEFQKKCLGKMDDVAHKQGRTILFVSHNINAVNRLCNKGVFLKKGRVEFSGNVNEAIDHYLRTSSVEHRGSVSFEIDAEKEVQITNIKIVDNEGNIIDEPINTTTPYHLNFTFNILKKINNLHLAFHLKSSKDEIVFFSDISDSEENFLRVLPGTYTVSVEIPNPMLVPDKYILNIGCVNKDNNSSYHILDKLAFEIVDIDSVRPKRPGYIYLPLRWDIKDLSLVR